MRKMATTQASALNGASTRSGYRRKLIEKRMELMAAMGLKFDVMAGQGRVAEDDQAQVSHEEFISLRLNKLDYDVLKLVNEALDRLDNGDYGACLRCEEPIAPRRLEVLPWAKYCVRCQEKLSSRHCGAEEPDLAAAGAR
ncbi:MAG: TraR/DksA family transcriptional regulator [Bryobacterales bacterium]|nr:TraR/DksA family transcriptional regulator [Bryobacterales bacterium]